LVEIGSVVSEEKIFFKFHPPFFIFSLEVGITGHNFGRGNPRTIPPKLVVIGPVVSEEKIFMCIPDVKLSSAVGAILVEGPNLWTY
jgi:hypothetical protein